MKEIPYKLQSFNSRVYSSRAYVQLFMSNPVRVRSAVMLIAAKFWHMISKILDAPYSNKPPEI